jgi:long-subunit acyl-CoA synthetase (AMP-forming)
MTVADTIAKSFLLAVETRGDKTAIREKHLGVWQSTSWRQWLQTAKEIAYALHASGFKSGDVASIIANATPEWVFADMGVLCAGGVSSGIYPTDSASQVEYLINDRTKVIFAEDDEQLDKIWLVARVARRLRRSSCSTWRASAASAIRWCCRWMNSWRSAAITCRAVKRCGTR